MDLVLFFNMEGLKKTEKTGKYLLIVIRLVYIVRVKKQRKTFIFRQKIICNINFIIIRKYVREKKIYMNASIKCLGNVMMRIFPKN